MAYRENITPGSEICSNHTNALRVHDTVWRSVQNDTIEGNNVT
jgi:hypothetical protein